MTMAFMSNETVKRREKMFARDLATAQRFHTHLWMAIVSHRISPEAARRAVSDSGESGILDQESVMMIGLGCFVCEQPLSAAIIDQPCPGDPVDRS